MHHGTITSHALISALVLSGSAIACGSDDDGGAADELGSSSDSDASTGPNTVTNTTPASDESSTETGSTGAADDGTDTGSTGADDSGTETGAETRSVVYIESNDPAGNEILAFERMDDGSLAAVPFGRYDTGGVGIDAGDDQHIGPLDSDHQIVMTADRAFVLATNSGDDTIAVFHTSDSGELTAVAGSPFVSGGPNPVSLGIVDDVVFVVNKAEAGTEAPSYNALRLGEDGTLIAIPDTTVERPIGGSPAIAYISPDQRFLFGTQFLDGARAMDAPEGQIDAFVIGDDGILDAAPGSPYALPPYDGEMDPPPPPVALDLVAHPSEDVLYVGFVTRAQLGVYDVDAASGELSYVTAAANSGMAICWFVINDDGTRLYSVNSASASISVYDISDARAPVELSALTMKQAMSGPPYEDGMGMEQTITSMPFELAFGPDESTLYVISQRVTTNADDTSGNYLHTLSVAADGSLDEPGEPIDLRDADVAATARPQGVLVF